MLQNFVCHTGQYGITMLLLIQNVLVLWHCNRYISITTYVFNFLWYSISGLQRAHSVGEDGHVEKTKKRRKSRKKSQLENQFPSYLQVGLAVQMKSLNSKTDISIFSSSGPKDPMSLCHGVASVVRPSVLPSFRPSVRPSVLPSVHSFQNASSSSFLNRFWFWLFHKIGLGGGFKTSTQNCEIHYLW